MSIGLVGKLALLGALAVGTFMMGDRTFLPQRPCDLNCCIRACQHDSSSGCQGSGTCCANLCG